MKKTWITITMLAAALTFHAAPARATALAELMAQTGAVNDQTGPDDKENSRFEFHKSRLMEKRGLSPEAWKELEAGRAGIFDRRFGPGTYDAVIRFSAACLYANGCERLLTADLISGAYGFIALEKDAQRGVVVRGSQAHRERDEKLKTEMRAAVEFFRPKAGASKEYTESFAAFADPILNNL